MSYEPGEPKFNPEGFQQPDALDELEEHAGLFDKAPALIKAHEMEKRAEEIARQSREKQSREKKEAA